MAGKKKVTSKTTDRGVRYAVTPDARGTYRVRHDETKLDKRFVDPAAAERFALEYDRDLGEDPVLRAKREAPLSKMAGDFLEAGPVERQWAAATLHSYTNAIQVNVVPVIGDVRCADWSADHTRKVLLAVHEKGLAASTIRHLGVVVRMLATWGAERGYISPAQAPCAGVDFAVAMRKKAKVQGQSANFVQSHQVPSGEMVDRIAVTLAETSGMPWLDLAVRVMAFGGLRFAEMAALLPRHIDVANGSILVREQSLPSGVRSLPKGGKVRDTILVPWLVDPLLARIAEVGKDRALFPNLNGRPLYPEAWKVRWHDMAAELDMPKRDNGRWQYTAHSLRHFFCTWALAKPDPDELYPGLGLEVADVCNYAGHSTPSFTYDRYVSVREGSLERALKAAEASMRMQARRNIQAL